MFLGFNQDKAIGQILHAIPRAKDREREMRLVREAKTSRTRGQRRKLVKKSVPVGVLPSFVKVSAEKCCVYSNANDATGLVTVCWIYDNAAFEKVGSWEDALKLANSKAAFSRFRNATQREDRNGHEYKVRETVYDVFWYENGKGRCYNPKFATLDQFFA